MSLAPPTPRWRERLHIVIFEADTAGGKAFDVALLIAIVASVLCVLLESVATIDRQYRQALILAEWVFTVLFTIEYILRLLSVGKPWRYALSFLGVVDLLAILPTYISLLLPGSQSLVVVRALRLLRVFRIFKLRRFLAEAEALKRALLNSRAKITVFLSSVLVCVVITGAAMHLIEGSKSGFTSIPQSMYWAIVTMTTVGYGDIAPVTPLGKGMAALIMVFGYSMIVVPTGIISAEIASANARISTQACPECSREGHDANAVHCKFCGARL
ncbi:MAG: ion transporter [Deltaproteobacteria bacterium]|nr:ion transporter [Deltaproteobacteria bacterium]